MDLLEEINKCHSIGGANAYVRDVLSRAYREIERLTVEVASLIATKRRLNADFDGAFADRERLRAALEPFAKFGDAYDEGHVRATGRDPKQHDLSDKASVNTAGIPKHHTFRELRVRDFRCARSTLNEQRASQVTDGTEHSFSALNCPFAVEGK